jgi:hypothetical protein
MLTKTHLLSNMYREINEPIVLDVKNVVHYRTTALKKTKVKVKVTLVQALRLCTVRTAHGRSRGIALLFHDHGTRSG